jgi:transcriptional regulator with XRE-family HTH domain
MKLTPKTTEIQRERATRGMTLRAAAAAAKISPETLRRVEHGKPTRMNTALAVASAYERDLDELFDVGEISPQDVILNAFVQTADAEQLRSVAFAIAVHGTREGEEMSGDGVYAKLAREFERGADEKPRRTGVRWELTIGEADTLLDAAAFAAKNADDDLAQRARQIVHEFRPSYDLDPKEP